MIKLSSLKPYPNNPRKISGTALEKLKESIQRDPEYMIARPIVVGQDNVILGGNQRHKACRSLGMKEIPDEWVRRVEWDGDKAKRFNVIDNLQMGDFDFELLNLEWTNDELLDLGFELDDLGISEDGVPDFDDAPDDKYQEQWGVIVMCTSEGHQEQVFNELSDAGHKCKVVVT